MVEVVVEVVIIIISIIRCNFLQSLNKFCQEGSEPPYVF